MPKTKEQWGPDWLIKAREAVNVATEEYNQLCEDMMLVEAEWKWQVLSEANEIQRKAEEEYRRLLIVWMNSDEKQGIASGVEYGLQGLTAAKREWSKTGICVQHGLYTKNITETSGSQFFSRGAVDDTFEDKLVQVCLVCDTVISHEEQPDDEIDF